MTLTELLTAVKESNLSKGQLEEYEMRLASLYGDYMTRIGELKKSRALYFLANERDPEGQKLPDVKVKRIYEGTPDGQELLGLESDVKAVSRVLSSIKSRIYQQY